MVKSSGTFWDWQAIRDYEERREAIRRWLLTEGKLDKLFDDELMREIRDRLLGSAP